MIDETTPIGSSDEDASPNEPLETALIQQIKTEIGKVFIGQENLVEKVLVALMSAGHILIEGHPGLGKTHLIISLAKTFQGLFKRIQFTPDLMPSDIVGHSMFDLKSQTFTMKEGPVFTNLLLADEINRAPAKTQSALLEVMQEQQVTIDGETYPINPPFMVLATQNPLEHDGTYPLPEAQLDRFMMKILVSEPTLSEEVEIAQRATSSGSSSLDYTQLEAICRPEDILALQERVMEQKVMPEVVEYAVKIVQATRDSQLTSYGASPRASIALIQAAKALSYLRSRTFVIPDDIKECSLPVLRHRIGLSPEVAIAGHSVDETLIGIVNSIEAPRA